MKHLRIFETEQEMTAAVTADKVSFIGMVERQGQAPIMAVHVHVPVYPSNLVISCSNNVVTISATNATTIEYKLSYEGTYTTYTEPFEITETVTVWAKASTSDGSIEAHQECVYVEPIDYTIPFYIEDISGTDNTVSITKNSSAPALTIEKSTDGETWENMGTTSAAGITATVPANGKLYLRCNTIRWVNAYGDYNYINTTSNCNVGGNIMSLLYGTDFTGEETTFPGGTENIANIFRNNTHIVNASDLILPATTLTDKCYYQMFYGCTSLTTTPVLPATTLATNCYGYMFGNCSSLTTAPALPVTTLANYCYESMFNGCTSLTTAPELLATTMAQYCYKQMFQGCTALTSAPALPATTLAQECYREMFYGCTSLTSAPVLPAPTLAQYCYTQMFYNCTNLNYIKCLATNISASYCTNFWVRGVAASGTFVKNSSMSSWTRGNDGIPTNWTVQDNS